MRVARVPGLLAERAGVDFKVALPRCEELSYQLAAGDMRGHGEQFFDILVQILTAAVGDGVRDVGDGTRHEGEGSWTAPVPGLVFELGQERDLEVVEIVVVAG